METFFNASVNLTETLKNYSENGKIEIDPELERRDGLLWSTTLYLAILLVSVAVNLKVLCILAGFPKRRRRKATSILIAHMSTVAIFYTFYVLLLVAEYANAVVDFRGKGICEAMTFIQNTLFGVFTFNIVAIIYERFRSFTTHSGSLLVHRIILLVWIISLLLSIPSIFTIVYVKTTENKEKLWTRRDSCKAVPLFGIQGASLVYEVVRFSLLHVFVVGYMAYALFRLRSKLRHLHVLKPSPNERMRRKVQSIRFIYIHFITFILVWLPLGTLLFVYRTLKRSMANVPSSTPEDEMTTASQIILRRALTALFLLYMVLNPFIYLLLIIENPVWKDCLCCYFGSTTEKATGNCSHHGDEENRGKQSCKQENVQSMEMSVFSRRQPDTKTRNKVEIITTSHSFDDSRISTVALTSCLVKEII